ncbi:MAG: S8 family serine peptidase [Miltoncostaeaceae bacterium]
MFRIHQTFAVGAAVLAGLIAFTTTTAGAPEPTKVRRPFVVVTSNASSARTLARAERARGARVRYVFNNVISGFSARMDEASVSRLRSNRAVRHVNLDRLVQVKESVAVTRSTTTGLWGLDRIDQRDLPLDGRINTAGRGQGAAVYVVDTGIRSDQAQFGSRVAAGYSVLTGSPGNGTDCNGHGTYVASVVGGTSSGVAPESTLIPVTTVGCTGMGLASDLIAGLDWIVADHQEGVPAVANISLYGPLFQPLNEAVDRTVADGVVVVAAAGNEANVACDHSPSSARSAITVAASEQDDAMAPWSGWGDCVDIVAPGNQTLAGIADPPTGGAVVVQGTSIGAAFTSGAAAVVLGINSQLGAAGAIAELINTATPNVLTGLPPGTPNRLLYIGNPLAPTGIPASIAVPGQPVLQGVQVTFRPGGDRGSRFGRYQVRGSSAYRGRLTLTIAGRSIDRRRVAPGSFRYLTRVGRRISSVRLVVRPADTSLSASSVRVQVRP